MDKLYENIKNFRIKMGMSQAQLADAAGYTDRSSIAKIEKGKVDLTQSKIMQFASVFHVTQAQLMGYETTDELNVRSVPMLGEIACGQPIFALEDKDSYVTIASHIHADFALTASGDSMINARIYDGDIVFIKEQNMVRNGEIAAVVIDDTATLKRFYYYKDKNMIILKAENPKYDDIILQDEQLQDVHVLGKAIALQGEIN